MSTHHSCTCGVVPWSKINHRAPCNAHPENDERERKTPPSEGANFLREESIRKPEERAPRPVSLAEWVGVTNEAHRLSICLELARLWEDIDELSPAEIEARTLVLWGMARDLVSDPLGGEA